LELLLEKGTLNTNNKKQVTSQQFLFLNFAILMIFVIWFLSARRSSQKKPTVLDLKRGGEAPGGVLQTTPENKPAGSSKYTHPKYQKFLDTEALKSGGEPKELNVLFNYNGHTWDAYEVLGVPAGADLVMVTQAYQAMLKQAAAESHEFLETAYRAILDKV